MDAKLAYYREARRILVIILGGMIFAAGVNCFIIPLKLYSGGVLGIAQIIRTLLEHLAGGRLTSDMDIAGIINFVINIPLFLIAYRSMSKKFLIRTMCSVVSQTVFLTVIQVPSEAVLSDVLSNCVVGGLISGAGIGLTLKCSGCGGGLDILGVYFTRKIRGFSVGKLALLINSVIFSVCAFLFDLETAVYSILYTVCFTLVLDRMHDQNINTMCIIFSKKEAIQEKIITKMHRGVTFWKGAGAYTGSDTYVMLSVVSKYETPQLKSIIKETDPQAFAIFLDDLNVCGNYEKRL